MRSVRRALVGFYVVLSKVVKEGFVSGLCHLNVGNVFCVVFFDVFGLVYEENAVQVVNFMLDYAGVEVFKFDCVGFPVEVCEAYGYFLCALYLTPGFGEGKAAFFSQYCFV